MIRVIHDARPLQEAHPTGVSRVTKHLMEALINEMPGAEHTIWTAGRNRFPLSTRRSEGVTIEDKHTAIPNLLTSLLHRLHLDLPRLYGLQGDVLVLYNLSFIGKPRIPYIQVVHDLSWFIEPGWYSPKSRLWHRWLNPIPQLQGAKHLFAVSQTTKQDLIDHLHIPAERITIIPIAAEPRPIASIECPRDWKDRPYLLACGGGNPRKNIAGLLAAWKTFTDLHPHDPTWLVIVGDEHVEPNQPRVHVFPWLNDETLRAFQANTTAFAYPSWYEGFGIPLQEAAQYNVPIIASSDSCIPETMPAGTLLVPPNKPHLWLAAIEHVLTIKKDRPQGSTNQSNAYQEAAKLIASQITRS